MPTFFFCYLCQNFKSLSAIIASEYQLHMQGGLLLSILVASPSGYVFNNCLVTSAQFLMLQNFLKLYYVKCFRVNKIDKNILTLTVT